jgi:hypothetical protein
MCMKAAINPRSLSLFLGTVTPALSKSEKQEKDKDKLQKGQQQQHAKPCTGK